MGTNNIEKVVADLQRFKQNHYFGKYRGLVTEVETTLGKLKAMVPTVYGTKTSPWAVPAVPFAGTKHGLVFLPEPGDGVWMEFEAGDPDVPIWTGFWWADKEWPAPASETLRGIITSQGLQILLDDKNKEIKLVHPGGAEIQMTNSGITLKMKQVSLVLTATSINMNSGALEVKK